jgi:hypothetical protein
LSAFANLTGNAFLSQLQWSFIFLPALFWTGTLIELLPDTLSLKTYLYRFWLYSVLPLSTLLFIASASTSFLVQGSSLGIGIFLFATLSLVPLAIAFISALRYYRDIQPNQPLVFIFVTTLFFALATGALLLPLEVFPRAVTLFGLGVDLLLLGLSIAFFDAFDLGETLIPEMSRSFIANFSLNFLFAGQVALVMLILGLNLPLLALLFSSITLTTTVQAFANPLQTFLDTFVFAQQPKLQKERADLRAASSAVLRSQPQATLGHLKPEDFSRLTRTALSNFSDLNRLGSSPLTQLPIVGQRLAQKGLSNDTLARTQELKQVLVESVLKLKPNTQNSFGTSDEWRHYNVLFFPYIIGIKPFSQRADHSHLEASAKEALEYFRTYVPERTFYNWQKVAASIIASDLQEQTHTLLAKS